MSKPDAKTLKVVFNGTKNESIAADGKQFTKFIGNLVRQFAGVSNPHLLLSSYSYSPFFLRKTSSLRNSNKATSS